MEKSSGGGLLMRKLQKLFLCSFALVQAANATNILGPLSGTGWNASAFNVVTLGVLSGNIDNAPVLAGNFSAGSDIAGGVAAYGNITDSATLTNGGVTNPYTDAFNVIVNGSNSSTHIVACGSVYLGNGGSASGIGACSSPTVSSTGLDFNFTNARTSLENYSYNVLTSSTLNQVNLLAAPVGNPNEGNGYDINITGTGAVYVNLNPAYLNGNSLHITYGNGVTAVIFNVAGSSISTGSGSFYYNGTQVSNNDFGKNPVLFNFYQATSISLGGSFAASILAPFANVTTGSDVLGQLIAGQVTNVGETHDDYFSGTGLVSTATPEPMTFALIGGGLLVIGSLRRRIKK
jgi:choice-of-anchor A domain-containing protein